MDRQFLEDTHAAALGPVALIGYGWPECTLREQFRSEIDLDACQVILINGQPAGYLSVEDRGRFWYIDAIAIGRRYQGRGIGTAVLREVLAEAGWRAVRLNVLHVNRARRLYERLGFRILLADARRQIMEWRAPAP